MATSDIEEIVDDDFYGDDNSVTFENYIEAQNYLFNDRYGSLNDAKNHFIGSKANILRCDLHTLKSIHGWPINEILSQPNKSLLRNSQRLYITGIMDEGFMVTDGNCQSFPIPFFIVKNICFHNREVYNQIRTMICDYGPNDPVKMYASGVNEFMLGWHNEWWGSGMNRFLNRSTIAPAKLDSDRGAYFFPEIEPDYRFPWFIFTRDD